MKGLDTVEACRGILGGTVKAFVGLGGNFVHAVPETVAMEAGWRKLPLTVQIITKLNRSAVIHGRAAFLLPCLGRIEIDRQPGAEQFVSRGHHRTLSCLTRAGRARWPAYLVGAKNRRRTGQGNLARRLSCELGRLER